MRTDFSKRTASNDAYAWTNHANQDVTAAINGLNQVASQGGATFAYDDRGNLTSDDGINMNVFDADNRLISAPGNAVFKYDAAGRLYADSATGVAVTRYLYDGVDLVGEYNSSGTLQRRYVHGASIDEPLVWYQGSGTSDRRWLIADERGSVIATANSSGSLLDINTYDEYGLPDGSNVGRFQYTGQTWSEAANLYYYKTRFYSSALGRFLQTDVIGYGAGLNMYAYVSDDPVNLADPFGMDDDFSYPCPGNTEDCLALRDFFLDAWVQSLLAHLNRNASAGPGGISNSVPWYESNEALLARDIGSGLVDAFTPVGDVKDVSTAWSNERYWTAGAFTAIGLGSYLCGPAKKACKGFVGRLLRLDACCFVAGTLVATENGLVPIEEIEGAGWVETANLRAGQQVATKHHELSGIRHVAHTDRVDATYNLTVAYFETYFVGEQQVLVHNCPNVPKKPASQGQFKGTDALRRENRMAHDAATRAGLNREQTRILHDEISGQGIDDFQELLRIAEDIKAGRY